MAGLGDDLVDEVGANKSGASCDEYFHWVICVKICKLFACSEMFDRQNLTAVGQ
jgi:hypothetical protein